MDNFLTIVITFASSLGGGLGAFWYENKKRDARARADRLGAAKRMMAKVALIQMMLESLKNAFIDVNQAAQSKIRALVIDSPQPGMIERVTFDIDELGFLLEGDGGEGSKLLMSLFLVDWQLKVVEKTIEFRAAAREEFEAVRRSHRIIGETMEQAAARADAQAQYRRLDALTDQFIENVDEGLRQVMKINERCGTVLKTVFPEEDVWQIKADLDAVKHE